MRNGINSNSAAILVKTVKKVVRPIDRRQIDLSLQTGSLVGG
jgi:hypothetical protein